MLKEPDPHNNMDWGQQISSKATKTLGFLRRNLAFAPRSIKEVAYKTLVRPKLEYAAPIWSPYSKLQINQVSIYLSIYLRILPYALADILGSCALSSNVSRKRKRIKA